MYLEHDLLNKTHRQSLSKRFPYLMKLSILSQFYPPDYAATGQLLEELATELIAKGIKVEVFVGQPGYAYDQALASPQEIRHGILVRRTRTSRLWPKRIRGRAVGGVLYCLRAFVKMRLAERRGDVILATTEPPYLLVVAYLLGLLYRRPYVCLIYDVYPDVAVSLGVVPESHWIVRFWRWLNQLTWQNADSIIVLSKTMRQLIVDRHPELAPKISIIHNWADSETIRPIAKTQNWFAQEQGFDQIFTVLYSGNLGRCHDLQTVMAAALILQGEPIRFAFIGAGAKLAECQAFAETHHLENCVFLPFQPKDVLPFSLTACDVNLVSVSEKAEGLVAPSKFYGCLAAGRAIATVCPPHSYLRDIIEESQCGKAIINQDSEGLANFLRDLQQNPELSEQMGKNGRVYLEEHFTRSQIADQYVKILEQAKLSA